MSETVRPEVIFAALILVSGLLSIGYAFYALGKITDNASFTYLTVGIALYLGGSLLAAVLIGPY